MNELGEFLLRKLPDLGTKLLEHLFLTGVSTGIAVVLGVPLGIWITRQDKLRGMLLGVVGVIQTIPSLALLAFFLPVLGIGAAPAIATLILYALLPIVRNTFTGLDGIAPSILEAARGLGFSDRQQLWMVELPLAIPVIIAGIRTSAVIGVGIATLSAFIGAGGLGDFIVRGIALNNTRLILLGAVPAAGLALLLDFLISRIELRLQPGRTGKE
jgi:osmoprotectant transport system permease protein